MDKITMTPHNSPNAIGELVTLEQASKKRVAKSLINYGGMLLGVVIVLAVIFIVSTDITITSVWDAANIGLEFFLLMFCAYSMYLGCADSGARAAMGTTLYAQSVATFGEVKDRIIQGGHQRILPDFCQHYILRELRSARTSVLANVGIDYAVYASRYEGIDKEEVERLPLSKLQKRAINKANEIKPIRLSPEMIMMRGGSSRQRAPLGITPEAKKAVAFGSKFFTTLIISLATSTIVLQATSDPPLVIVATCSLKLVTIVVNGFLGYKFGYENVSVDTVAYMSNQVDLMEQVIRYSSEIGGNHEANDNGDDSAGEGHSVGASQFHDGAEGDI